MLSFVLRFATSPAGRFMASSSLAARSLSAKASMAVRPSGGTAEPSGLFHTPGESPFSHPAMLCTYGAWRVGLTR